MCSASDCLARRTCSVDVAAGLLEQAMRARPRPAGWMRAPSAAISSAPRALQRLELGGQLLQAAVDLGELRASRARWSRARVDEVGRGSAGRESRDAGRAGLAGSRRGRRPGRAKLKMRATSAQGLSAWASAARGRRGWLRHARGAGSCPGAAAGSAGACAGSGRRRAGSARSTGGAAAAGGRAGASRAVERPQRHDEPEARQDRPGSRRWRRLRKISQAAGRRWGARERNAGSHGFRRLCDRGHVRRWPGSGTRPRT